MNEEPEPIKIIELSYNPKDIIGKGGFAHVYRGLIYSLKPVAIKRLLRIYGQHDTILKREIELMKKADDHCNILKYIHHEMDSSFIYIATELCRGTLEDYFNGKYIGPTFESEKEILLQVTRGLAHLHEKDIVHRDIKPTNILIFVPEANGSDPVMKLADFGISKALNPGEEDYTNTSMTNPNGTKGWMAPEVYQSKRFDSKVDIFQLGLIFAYTLSIGNKHPFGDDAYTRIWRTKQMGSMTLAQRDLKEPYSYDNIALELIQSMLNMEPDDRPAVGKIVDSIFFNPFMFHHRQPTKEWKDMNELLRDADFSGEEKAAILRKDLIWICCMMKYNLFQVLTLMLAEKGADLNARDEDGRTPILWLCRCYHKDDLFEILELFINKGAKMKAVDPNDRTMLHLVCENYSHRNLIVIVDLLIKAGVPDDAKDKDGNTALHLLVQYYKHDNLKDIVRLLKENGARLNVRNDKGLTPLIICCAEMKTN